MTAHPCYFMCAATIARVLGGAAAADGETISIEIACNAPLIMTDWWKGYHCPHGYEYWVRPTQAQLDQWEKDETP